MVKTFYYCIMILQLADKPGFKARLIQVGKFITSPAWIGAKTAWIAIWNNLPRAEKDRQAANLVEVKNSLNQNAGINLFSQMDFEKADWILNNLPGIITDANNKLAITKTSNLGERRVLARYLKSFNQILDETYAWGIAATPPDPSTAGTPPPANKLPQPKDDNKQPAFPGSPGIQKPFFENPIVLIGGGLLAFFIINKMRK